ncbi:DNA polymerase III subunit alpha [Candidatus Babeliales bacterium]|nr:DNA polymerase III subunit alpha [Candidatus Babeliales bacterium]
MDTQFTHLHLHTEFSLLDGANRLDKLVALAKEQGLKSLAITDHGNIFGAVKFFQLCKKAGIKPILGIEAYFTEDISVKSAHNKYYHLLLLVQNEHGYKNLCKLIAHSYQDGFYFKPRIDYALLKQHSDGLIASTACLGGHIPQLLKQGNREQALEKIDWFIDIFGQDRFFLEVQPAKIPDVVFERSEQAQEQHALNMQLLELAKEKNLKVIATCDCHYLTREDREAHEVMLCIQTHHKITDPDRFSFGDARVHMRTVEEMLAAFPDNPEVVWNTGFVADQCSFEFETGKLFFPDFAIPEEHTPESYFTKLCQTGLETLITNGRIPKHNLQAYRDRLDEEMKLIINMGFVGYFLIVSDFIMWARRNDIPVGPGRGSAAGSLVAWTLEITNVDPIEYNLLFERFLNPERISMPDIDIDFCIEGREKVIQYIRDFYGHDKVCQIITFGTMMAKGVVKDVARVLGIPFEDSNMITGMIPDQLKISLNEALEQEPRLQELIDSNPTIAKLFDLAKRLEGLTRHASKHAAGIVISPDPIAEMLPVYVPPKTTELVTQYAMTELESIGFLKIDLLGLKNLTLIKNALALIEKNYNIQLDIDKLPLDDEKTFQLICAGNTTGVFQLESDGLKEVLRKLQPEKFEDIIAVNALYRPGPLGSGMVDDFIARRHGRQKITYLFPELEPVLRETYGVIVYQEQVMKIASAIAGYSLGQADILRKAMGKKKVEVMAQQRELFLKGSVERGFDEKKAGELFDLMAYFAGYGFNKSHSTAYATIAYQTAYLKANYAPEFMACLISLEATHAEKMSFYLQEAKDMNIPILPPSINRSRIDFDVETGKIIFGLRGIKNVGLTALENIIAERDKEPFFDLLDFCKRIDLRTANKRVIESLICAGTFDDLAGNRAQQMNELQLIIDRASAHKKSAETGQMGLFEMPIQQANSHIKEAYAYQALPEWDNKTKLEKEQQVVGFYLSAHPLDSYKQYFTWLSLSSFATTLQKTQTYMGNKEPMVCGGGLLKTSRTITTKKGDRMAFIQLEDQTSKAEIVLFPRLFKKVEVWLTQYHVFIVKGAIDLSSPHLCKIKATDLVPAELFFEQWPSIERVTLTLPVHNVAGALKELSDVVTPGKIPLSLRLQENGKTLHITTKKKIAVDQAALEKLRTHHIATQITI